MIRLYVGDRRTGVRCEGLWRAWTEDRSRCEWIAGIHGVGMGHGRSVGQATLARPRSLFFGLCHTRGHGKTGRGDIDTFRPIARPNRDKSIEGHKVVGELTMENVCRRKRNMLFQTFWVKFLPVLGV